MSNKTCCVPGCPTLAGSQEILHKFPNPNKDKELFTRWVYAVGGSKLSLENEHIFYYRRVCHKHFEPKYWCRNNRLSNIALPTTNMLGLSLSKFTSARERILRPLQNLTEASTSKVPDPVTVISHMDAVALQFPCQSVVEDVAIKENIEPVTVAIDIGFQSLLNPQSATRDFQKKDKFVHSNAPKKKLRKRVAVKEKINNDKVNVILFITRKTIFSLTYILKAI